MFRFMLITLAVLAFLWLVREIANDEERATLRRIGNGGYWTATCIAAVVELGAFATLQMKTLPGGTHWPAFLFLTAIALLIWLIGCGFRRLLTGPKPLRSISQRDRRRSADPLQRFHEEYLQDHTSRPW